MWLLWIFPGKPFFSPHPISILNTTDKIISVLEDGQRVTYGVIRKSAYQDLLKNCVNRFSIAPAWNHRV